MSKKTISQMEAALMDKIEQAKRRLDSLQQKHKLEIGTLAYRHGLHKLNSASLDLAFAKIASESVHGNS